MKKQQVTILVISIANPILVGIYQNNKLYDTITQDGKTSDILPSIFQNILDQYNIQALYYVSSPGSFMAIKVAYIFLKTLSITLNIPLKAMDGFSFNNNTAIKALGKKYFFKSKDGNITTRLLNQDDKLEDFTLPNHILNLKCLDDTLPQYHLPAVH
jgi:tRNA A37 threonylcarbamoyladenosine modification protein TsaB